ncbi:hypothetical protein [Shewanella sp. FDAARGOS_354]|nr:hypothetical protein [Shewanella sp. FDAARGOS_354]
MYSVWGKSHSNQFSIKLVLKGSTQGVPLCRGGAVYPLADKGAIVEE